VATCQTYPILNIIPRSVQDSTLEACARYRTKNRFPALTYFDKLTGCSIWRSSQSCQGILANRNEDDERVLLEIGRTNVYNPQNKLAIFDARSWTAAQANRFKGGGLENVKYYTNCELLFCDIDNIHGVRDAYSKVMALG
jgi:myotubularin-related protein 6/7/8